MESVSTSTLKVNPDPPVIFGGIAISVAPDNNVLYKFLTLVKLIRQILSARSEQSLQFLFTILIYRFLDEIYWVKIQLVYILVNFVNQPFSGTLSKQHKFSNPNLLLASKVKCTGKLLSFPESIEAASIPTPSNGI